MAVAVAVAVSGGVAVPVAVPVAGLTKRFFNQKDLLINVWGYGATKATVTTAVAAISSSKKVQFNGPSEYFSLILLFSFFRNSFFVCFFVFSFVCSFFRLLKKFSD